MPGRRAVRHGAALLSKEADRAAQLTQNAARRHAIGRGSREGDWFPRSAAGEGRWAWPRPKIAPRLASAGQSCPDQPQIAAPCARTPRILRNSRYLRNPSFFHRFREKAHCSSALAPKAFPKCDRAPSGGEARSTRDFASYRL